MIEPEFMLVDGPPTEVAADGVSATVVERAGRRKMRSHVLVDVSARRPRRKRPLLLLVLVLLGVGAGIVVWRRRQGGSQPADGDELEQLEPLDAPR